MAGILQFSFLADIEGVTEFDCPGCEIKMCIRCKTEWHATVTCEQNMEIYASASDDFTTDHVEAHRQNCPRCDVICEKEDGLVSIQCPTCEFEFCFECGVDYEFIRNTGTHMHRSDCSEHRVWVVE